MNIISLRQEDRRKKIQEFSGTLRSAFNAGVDVDKEKLVAEACSRWGTSRRTNLEYLNIALAPFDYEEIKFEGRKLLISNQKTKEDINE